MSLSFNLPLSFFDVAYNSQMYPGVAKGLGEGANCQQFAYEVLRYNGFMIGDFRSDELMQDVEFTELVHIPRPMDLGLFNSSHEAYGAHVGVFVSHDKVLHLSKQVSYPTVWSLEDIQGDEKYRICVGIKRPVVIYEK